MQLPDIYTDTLDREKMNKTTRVAYEAFCSLKAVLFDVSQRLVQFLVRGKYKNSDKINFILEASR